jgi:diguanylate cyclase (GGDEF)-like protein/PAS domain S-box-containing protein
VTSSTGAEPAPVARLASFAVYAAGPIAILAILWLHTRGLLADTPAWFLVVAILGTGVVNLLSSIWLAGGPESAVRLQVRVIGSVLSTGLIIYAAGWGSVLVIAYALSAVELVRTAGSRTVVPTMWWSAVVILTGELAVALDLAPSMIDPQLGHAVALFGGFCLLVVVDVLGRSARAAEQAEERVRERGEHFESLVERAADIIGVISAEGTVRSVSPAVEAMLGYTPDEVEGRPISGFLHPQQQEHMPPMLRSVLDRRGEATEIEIRLVHRDGSDRIVWATLTSPTEQWGDEIIVNLHDLTTQRRLEQRLRHDARHDPLTGLLNRTAFGEVLERVGANAARHGTAVGMLFVDLDGFKEVNDRFGHDTGDRVLVQTAERLTAALRQDEALARLGGDEFAVLLHPVEGVDAAIDVAERILEVVGRPLEGLPPDVRVGASIGIALRSHEGIEMSTLMRQADEAMYTAKRNGRARWEVSLVDQAG